MRAQSIRSEHLPQAVHRSAIQARRDVSRHFSDIAIDRSSALVVRLQRLVSIGAAGTLCGNISSSAVGSRKSSVVNPAVSSVAARGFREPQSRATSILYSSNAIIPFAGARRVPHPRAALNPPTIRVLQTTARRSLFDISPAPGESVEIVNASLFWAAGPVPRRVTSAVLNNLSHVATKRRSTSAVTRKAREQFQ